MATGSPRRADGVPTVARDAALSLVAIVLVGGSAAVYGILVARTLGQTALGHAGLALATGLGVAQLATAGIAPAVTRFAATRRAGGDPAAARHALATGLAAAALLGLSLAIAARLSAPTWAPWVGLPAALVRSTAWLILLQSLYIALKAALYGVGRVATYTGAEVATALVFFGYLAVLLAGVPMSLLAPFLAANAMFVVLAGASVWRATRISTTSTSTSTCTSTATALTPATPAPTLQLPTQPDISMGRFAALATIGSMAALTRLNLVVLVTGLARPAAEVGLLQAALAFLPPVLLIPRALELALFPALAGAYGRGDLAGLRDQASAALESVAAGLGLVAGTLAVAGPVLLVTLYGPAFAAATPVLDGVLLSAWALGIAVPAVVALAGAGAVAIPNAAGVAALATSLAAWARLVPDHGAAGAAAGLALGSLVIAAVPNLAARRQYGLALGPSGRVTVRTGLLLAAGLILTRFLGWPTLPVAGLYGAAVLAVEGPRLLGRGPFRWRAAA